MARNYLKGCSAKFCLERVEEDGANAKNTFEEDGIKFIVTLEQSLEEIPVLSSPWGDQVQDTLWLH